MQQAPFESTHDSQPEPATHGPDRTRTETILRWLGQLPFPDPHQQRQGALLQGALLGGLLSGGVALAALPLTGAGWPLGAALLGSLLVLVRALAHLRGGRLPAALRLGALGLLLLPGVPLLGYGLRAAALLLPALLLPAALAGALAGRRALTSVGAAALATVTAAAARDGLAPASLADLDLARPAAAALVFGLALTLTGLLLEHLRAERVLLLERSLQREREREQSHALLTDTLERRAADLEQTVVQLREHNRAILAHSPPLLPLLPGVLLAPLSGSFDNQRMLALIDRTFAEVECHRAHHVIFDLSATARLDPASAAVLLRIASALRHLDAALLVVGLRAETALTLSRSGLDLSGLRCHASLEDALRPLLVEYAQTWPALSARLSADLHARTGNN